MRSVTVCLLASAAVTIGVQSARAGDCGSAAMQMDLNVCASDSAKRSDAALNAAYVEIRRRLKGDPATTKLLVTAKAWIGFCDAECAFSSSGTIGGSMNGMIEDECLDALTRKRLVELNAYLHCQEGDPACPVPDQ